jgi:hypothetical protein
MTGGPEFTALMEQVQRAKHLLASVALSPLLSGLPAGGRKLLLEELYSVQGHTETVIRIADAHRIIGNSVACAIGDCDGCVVGCDHSCHAT